MTKRKIHLLLPLIIAAITPMAAKAAPNDAPAITPAPQSEPRKTISVTIIGEVAHSGTFALPGAANFLDALRAAGGLEKVDNKIDLSNIKIRRAGATLTVNMKAMFAGDYAQNLRLQDRDIIIISRLNDDLLMPRTRPKVKPSTNLAPAGDVLKRLDALKGNSEKPPTPGARGFDFNGMTVYFVPLTPRQ